MSAIPCPLSQAGGQFMLVLARKVGEKILIGENISVTVVRIAPGVVRIGIEAPNELPIVREEIQGQVQQQELQKDVS